MFYFRHFPSTWNEEYVACCCPLILIDFLVASVFCGVFPERITDNMNSGAGGGSADGGNVSGMESRRGYLGLKDKVDHVYVFCFGI